MLCLKPRKLAAGKLLIVQHVKFERTFGAASIGARFAHVDVGFHCEPHCRYLPDGSCFVRGLDGCGLLFSPIQGSFNRPRKAQ